MILSVPLLGKRTPCHLCPKAQAQQALTGYHQLAEEEADLAMGIGVFFLGGPPKSGKTV